MMQHDVRMRYSGEDSVCERERKRGGERERERGGLGMPDRHECVTEKHVRNTDTEKD